MSINDEALIDFKAEDRRQTLTTRDTMRHAIASNRGAEIAS